MSKGRGIALITGLSIIEGLQALCVLAHIYAYIPITLDFPAPPGLEPERESYLYVLFLLVTAGIACVLFPVCLRRLDDAPFHRKFLLFLSLECFWTLFLLFAFFKWVTYSYPFYNILPLENGGWVRPFFYGVIMLSIISKVFWPELCKALDRFLVLIEQIKISRRADIPLFVLMMALLAALIYPNIPLAVDVVGSWSKFTFWMAWPPTRFLLSRGDETGQIIGILVTAHLAAFGALMAWSCRYYNSRVLAAAALLVIVQMALFNYGNAPLCWDDPRKTLLAAGVDLKFFFDPQHPPMYMALRVRQFLSYFMGYALPVFYLFILQNALGRQRTEVVLSIVGLAIYTHYLSLPEVFAFGAVCWPAVLLAGKIFRDIIAAYAPQHARLANTAVFLGALFLLLTNRVFVTYPHWWMHHVR